MWIEWVNHASFIVESGPIRMICDPWLEGLAFNNGWALLSPTKLKYEDFAQITHIWLSHEHPDHFSPQSLRNIPEAYRRKITVLFHRTKDKRVIGVCGRLGFRTQELPEEKPWPLADDFKVICGRQGLVDSWLWIEADGKTLLNMNDCVYGSDKRLYEMKRKLGKIDVLLTQFSYANWVGNPDDAASHAKHAERKRNEMARQVRVFQPSTLIPCASFVVFAHDENFFMNQGVNHIKDIYSFGEQVLKVPTVILYPGDCWAVGSPTQSGSAVRRYERDFERAMSQPRIVSAKVEFPKLQEAARAFVRAAGMKNNQLLLRAMSPAVIRLLDLGIDAELSFRRGLVQVSGAQVDIMASSDSLLYCFNTGWGGETLAINGRYQVPPGGKPARFFRIFRVPRYNEIGRPLNFAFLGNRAMDKVRTAILGS